MQRTRKIFTMSGLPIQPALHLEGLWWIHFDDLQWIIAQQRESGVGVRKTVSFVSSTKDILLRCVREKGISPTAEALNAIASWPSTFREWFAGRQNAAEIAAVVEFEPVTDV